jgi:uncharacterized membrane protein
MNSENTLVVLKELVHILKVKLTPASIKAELYKHPEHYSFLGMADVLRTFRIPNGVFELQPAQLGDLETPFIAHLSSNNGEFVLVTQINDEQVTLFNEAYHHTPSARTWFNENYTGKVLVAEADEAAGEAGYALKKRRELREKHRNSFLLAGAVLGVACLLAAEFGLLWSEPLLFISLVLKLMGTITGLLLAFKSINISNPLLNRLCFAGPRSDCNQVIYSPHANITDELSWAEAGVLYFCSTFFALLCSAAWPGLVIYIAALALLAALYIFYSLYLQLFVIKQLCVLCIITLALLGLDAFCLFGYLRWPLPLLPIAAILKLCTCVVFPAVAWAAVKPGIKASRFLITAREQLRNIKGRNIHLFGRMLAEQPVLAIPPLNATIVEGEPSAPTLITIVSKPFCEACGEAHSELSAWLEVRNDIRVQLVFYVLNYDGDAETEVATYMMRAYRELGPEKTKEAINEWFGSKTRDFGLWAQRYPLYNNADVSADLKLQQQWCNANDISVTPMILINGRQLPAFYKLEEIKYFI